MKSKDLIKNELENNINAALQSEDSGKLAGVLADYAEKLENDVKADAEAYRATNDASILARRGVRQLTSAESKFWNAFIDNAKNPQAAAAHGVTGSDLPQTILESVFEDVQNKFPLLNAIDLQYTSAMTKLYISDSAGSAEWAGLLSDKEQTADPLSGLKVIDIVHNKVLGYVAVSNDMLEEGPQWVDAYVRAYLAEAIGLKLEDGIVNGNGLTQPVGMTKDLSKDVSQSTGYADKTAVSLTELSPEKYGEIVSTLAETDGGKARPVEKVTCVVSPVTYFKKIMPATTVLTQVGTYVSGVFPYPTEVVQSAAVPQDKVIFCLGKKYKLCVGTTGSAGKLEVSNQSKFLSDLTVYRTKVYANGQPTDNNSCVVADVSKLEPYSPTVKTKTSA